MSDLFAYKVLTAEQYEQFKADGVFKGAPIDLTDGYIHMSTRDQAAETVAKHFAGQDRLVMLMIDLAPFGDTIKWEESRGGALFPHLYADLPISAVAGKVVLRIGDDGRHQFPAGF
ncbi:MULTISPECIES: DUF952 domain-containing protein [Sphingobium]|uniref:Glutathione S-transferase n=2 Tax=Sphingobium cupriresistens TaxID=1132417 RepID=A0A0J7Y3E5_9SPHN|nr:MULTISPECIES: DUF952 domain-containing protein [Sphingobium]KMS58344.1 hypothetical protein V473_09565 [Sphingobium cupriresistens LL01]MBJ7377083.1 DUF952 domain-containing protein [Sphingobium sp.]RYM09512.1 DUF952 domain-containing protein [Sphingobium cupriresistens]WCP11796.1 hypothetical protein sphantq_00184 [Sphingobium sp. AntQ-1]